MEKQTKKNMTAWFVFDGTLVVRKILNIRGNPVVMSSSQ